MRLALAQLNPLVGDLEGNGRRILAAAERARSGGADLVLTPELSLWGYPPRDLLLRPALIQRQERVLATLAAACPGGLALLVGVAEPAAGRRQPGLYNALALVQRGGWRHVCRKRLLPTYDVFDERRYFLPGDAPAVLELEAGGRPWRLGLTICEDLWVEENLRSRWPDAVDPIADLVPGRIDLLLNLSASPFGRGKGEVRQALAARAAARLGVPVAYLNQVGGNDELVFDGASFVVDGSGRPVLRLACAAEDLAVWDATTPAREDVVRATPAAASPDPWEQLLRVLVLGVRDYTAKCGFQRALLGLSGGIDSALVAVIAAAALGPDRVEGLRMPSPFSSAGSLDDADGLARRLGLRTATLPIAPLMEAFAAALTPELGAPPRGVTEENLQSRIRGTLLMAVANEKGGLLLSTGNKSELAVGYCTLYGDMNGGLAVIGDLYKTTISGLCDWLDGAASGPCRAALGLPPDGELIGAAIRTKPPSAELRPDQRDSDSLPDYAVLDPLLKACIEEMRTPEELVADGADRELVARVAGLLRRAEFKRRQAAPVLKVSDRAFGSGWRMPIASA